MKAEEQLEKDATLITGLIMQTDIEVRGNLLAKIGEKLKANGQGFTSALFFLIAKHYCITK